ncbi:hypothetical protein CLI70_08890 [Prevotella intermedia]|nr:hypothetical protein CLI70_08890 [Prevotella intermedia]
MQGKSGSFAMQKSRFRNAKAQVPLFKDFIFTKLEGFLRVCSKASKLSRKTRFSRRKNRHKKRECSALRCILYYFPGG